MNTNTFVTLLNYILSFFWQEIVIQICIPLYMFVCVGLEIIIQIDTTLIIFLNILTFVLTKVPEVSIMWSFQVQERYSCDIYIRWMVSVWLFIGTFVLE